MSGTPGQSTHGNGYARALLGVMGVVFAAGGMLITWLSVRALPIAFLGAAPGVVLAGYGVNLLFACAFYDEAEIGVGPLGLPIVRGIRSQSHGEARFPAEPSVPLDSDGPESSDS
jgi:hypothetical protein